MPSPKVQTTVVVPCYNEENRLSADRFLEFASRNADYRFLFVDDGSTDGTFKLLESLRLKQNSQFDVLKLERNSGKAEAVRQGLLKAMEAQPKFLGYWDADLSTPLDALPLFLRRFEERAELEMVLGSRVKLMGHSIKRNELRHYLGRIFATAASIVLKLSIYDTQCGAKLFRSGDAIKEIFLEPFHSRWIFDVELIARYLKQRGHTEGARRIAELPLPVWHDSRSSKVRPTDFFNALGELIWIYMVYR